MKFYYNDVGYTCNWKTKMSKDMWYSMEPAKVRVSLPKNILQKILLDVKEDVKNNTLHDIIKFKILKSSGEELYFNDSINENVELWKLECYLNSSIISSEYKKKGIVSVHFDISVIESELLEKSELRNILLDEIL
jgi:sugar-specific transcriptional regulator TrmB